MYCLRLLNERKKGRKNCCSCTFFSSNICVSLPVVPERRPVGLRPSERLCEREREREKELSRRREVKTTVRKTKDF